MGQLVRTALHPAPIRVQQALPTASGMRSSGTGRLSSNRFNCKAAAERFILSFGFGISHVQLHCREVTFKIENRSNFAPNDNNQWPQLEIYVLRGTKRLRGEGVRHMNTRRLQDGLCQLGTHRRIKLMTITCLSRSFGAQCVRFGFSLFDPAELLS
jgi:hypothetical protein